MVSIRWYLGLLTGQLGGAVRNEGSKTMMIMAVGASVLNNLVSGPSGDFMVLSLQIGLVLQIRGPLVIRVILLAVYTRARVFLGNSHLWTDVAFWKDGLADNPQPLHNYHL